MTTTGDLGNYIFSSVSEGFVESIILASMRNRLKFDIRARTCMLTSDTLDTYIDYDSALHFTVCAVNYIAPDCECIHVPR
jgi:hypothetical protein